MRDMINLDVFIYIALIGLLLGVLFLSGFIAARLRRLVRRMRGQPVPPKSALRSAFQLLQILLWLAVTAAALFLLAFVQSYRSFTKEELVARVRCVPAENQRKAMVLAFTPVHDGEAGETEKFNLRGDQWVLEGDILKWENWLNFLGLHTRYRLTRVRGRYTSTPEEQVESPTAYSLVADEENPIRRFLYGHGHRFPYVAAVYGNAVYQYPSKKNLYEIYVTTSGFSARIREP